MVQDIPSTVELRLPSKLGFEKVAMQTAAGVARLMGFPDERVDDLKTAVAEACINAIEHGNRFDERLSIGIVLSMEDGELEVKILDSGSGPHKKVHAPDIDRKMHGDEEARGMGMFLMQALVDEAEWTQTPLGGGCVRLMIRLDKEEE
ncbi:MAG TPA: ATP-binding protein [Acidobacteriaceae bacterium]|jgi:serine/threonine-protein kinase RsbW|nr:ATP-binding protein [Acidobacteriaceae bacterium]